MTKITLPEALTMEDIVGLIGGKDSVSISILEDGLEDSFENPEQDLPDHCERHVTKGELERFTQLSTRDGRSTGNAVIFDITIRKGLAIFHCITDACNVIELTMEEMITLFHPPEYILNDFPNNQNGDVSDFLNDWYDDNLAS